MTQRIGETAHRLDLSLHAALRGVHSVFHVSLLRDWQDNGVYADMLPFEIDGEASYEFSGIKGCRDHNGKL